MILVNGKLTGQINVLDRGLHYGDGLFETIAYKNKHLLLWDEHWRRLAKSAKILNIDLPDKELIRQELDFVVKGQEDMVLKLLITRGVGGRGYKIPDKPNPNRIIISSDWPNHDSNLRQTGVIVRLCEMRLTRNPKLAGIKHLNRLENVIARSEWRDHSIFEGLMLDQDNYVIEGTMTNLFIIKDNEIFTSDLKYCGVEGVMREQLIKLASQLDISVKFINIKPSTLQDADEILLSNSIIGLWPVKQIQNHSYKRKPTVITEKLQHHIYTGIFY